MSKIKDDPQKMWKRRIIDMELNYPTRPIQKNVGLSRKDIGEDLRKILPGCNFDYIRSHASISILDEIVGSSGHEKPGLERPGRLRGERIGGSCGKHLWTLSDSFNDTTRHRRSNCSTNNFQIPCRSKSQIQAPFPRTPFNTETSVIAFTVVPSQINVECHKLAKGGV
ncbi:hypothetical protein TNCV_2763061 [Trichonephila clavipes]|nr:hypothetical protein TNCV_2763061 [Trichonephila clavipes]